VLGSVSRPFYVGSAESELVAAPDGALVYAASGASTALTVIDVATDTAEAQIPVGPDCNRIALSPDGSTAYLTNKESALLLAVDLRSRSTSRAASASRRARAGSTWPGCRRTTRRASPSSTRT
jgi:YVTN family beta-propeller protein